MAKYRVKSTTSTRYRELIGEVLELEPLEEQPTKSPEERVAEWVAGNCFIVGGPNSFDIARYLISCGLDADRLCGEG